jgi:predicted component of type VI protein secretion system
MHYEPRLKDVTVKAFPPDSGSRSATLLIGGTVTIDMKFRQLSFQIQLDQRSGNKANAS